MMPDVAHHDVTEGAYGNRLPARRPCAPPRLVVQPAQPLHARSPQCFELVDQLVEAAAIETRRRHIVVFVESRQRMSLSTAEAERAEGEHPLCVQDVPDDFAHAPLAGRIAILLERGRERTDL